MTGFQSGLAAVLLAIVLATPATAAEPGLTEGLAAYFQAEFDQAVVALKRSRGALAQGERAGVVAYFLGRSFQEMGLRGLALHYLGRAEAIGGWRSPALREIARAYFQVEEYPAVLEVFHRLHPGEHDGEILYLAGVAASVLGRWDEARSILDRVRPGDPEYRYALYARAQSSAARERFEEALADLSRVISLGDPGRDEWSDQAEILRGKILYLEGRVVEARAAFASVESSGSVGFEALRGLLLTYADAEAASRIRVSEARPTDSAILLTMKAIAAEERADPARATELRERLRSLVEGRLRALELLAASSGRPGALEQDLASFAKVLRLERWRKRRPVERGLLGEALATDFPETTPPPGELFEPRDALFYDAWEAARSDPRLRGSIELLSRSQALAHDVEALPTSAPFWMFWASAEARRLGIAMATLRLFHLEQLFADHLHTLGAIPRARLQERKRISLARAVSTLRRLYLGRSPDIPASLSNLRAHLEYKEADMLSLIASVPERSTDPATSLLGNLVDLLEQTRAGLEDLDVAVPTVREGAAGVPKAIREANASLGRELAARIHEVVDPTVRRQVVLFTRLAADNEGSLSRLYARSGGEKANGR